MKKKYDIVIIILPFIYVRPQIGTALLKSNIEKYGYTCKIIDWNYKLFEISGNNDFGKWMQVVASSYNKDINNAIEILEENISSWLDEIKQYNPDYIGLSINFTKFIEPLYEYILKPIREKFYDKKIIAGGGSISLEDLDIGKKLVEQKYIDWFVKGDGEDAIITILKNNKWDNNTGLNRIKNLDDYPNPDYTDTLKNKYNIQVPIITTRGCIKNCKFCFDVFKGAYRRSPINIALEMVKLCEQFDTPFFIFNDSLSNSNTEHLIELTTYMIEYKNRGLLPSDLKWDCNMCCLPQKDNHKIMYKNVKESGCNFIFVGIESGSDRVRKEMNKSIKHDDIMFMVDHIKKNNLILFLHLIIGYYTETEEDFQDSLNLVNLLYDKLGPKNLHIDLGPTFQIHNLDKWEGIEDDGISSWTYKDNTFLVRFERWLRIYNLCQEKDIFTLTHYKNVFYNQLLKYDNIDELKKKWVKYVN